MAGRRSRTCRRSRPRLSRRRPRPSSRATIRPTSPSTARSIPIAAASMAASTASRGRRMPIWACRRGSTSKASFSSSPNAAELLERNCRNPSISRAPSRWAPTPIPISRSSAISDHAADPGGAGRVQASGRHRHQIGAGHARHRHPGADGGAGLAKVALSITTLDRKLARAWSRAPRRPRSGSRRSARWRLPAFRPR